MEDQPAGSSTRRRVIRGFAILAILGALYTLAGFFLAPPLLRFLLVNHVGQFLRREVSIRQVRVNPLTVSATLLGLDIRDRLPGGPGREGRRRVHPWETWHSPGH